ncbi:DUF6638 family protein [Halomarinibacterium sedimenti]|uniref:DUF6638 family protein n=1 Tax=Halomarinibacterium sedimenti TaxID=2857106 RepID=UPI0021080A41|nr:DUF6638 family protein [Halomarinibacterium sedimenti]
MIDKLKAAGLFGGALVPVSGSLAKRYNDCLALLGMQPTKLTSFSIDAMGWSPEIAEEMKEPFYLNLGEANSNAIIVSPMQEGKPVHNPFHSFDRNIMEAIFAAYPQEIRDITKDAAICVQLDQNIDAYYAPFDLLQYKKITLSFTITHDLQNKQKEQKELVATFHEGNNFIDLQLHEKLLESAKSYGDLRHRKLQLEPIVLDIGSFYTKAFGGIFVLRDFITDIIVFEDLEIFQKAIKDTVHDVTLFHVSHNELTSTLVNHLIADFDIKKAAKTERYARIKKQFFIENFSDFDHPIKEVLDSPFLFKKYINELDEETQKKILSVEIYNQRKIVERELNISDVVALEYTKALLEPHSSLEEEQKELIWRLLTEMIPKDPLYLYWYNKEEFYKAFKTWPESYQDWVIDCILEHNKKDQP